VININTGQNVAILAEREIARLIAKGNKARDVVEELSREAWETFQKIGQPQQGLDAQKAWDSMQEKHLAMLENEIRKQERSKT
jgi:Fe-S cluster biosynthesis and repair protein YggX